MKLELKHLAPYLPYGLKAVKGVTRIEITAISIELPHVYHTSYLGSRLRVVSNIQDIKPILRPLSDLTKEIEHNGEKFIPIDILCNEFSQYDCFEFDNVNILNNPYSQIQNLLEWHFDIYGLIEKGLAIDINTLEK